MLNKPSSIKVVFKQVSDETKKNFGNSKCLVTISVGQEVHESEKFEATVDLISKSFNSCVILVDDTLQRHTMAIDKREDAQFYYEKSLLEGEKWLDRNKKYLDKIEIPMIIKRWDDFLMHDDFTKMKEKILCEIRNDKLYHDIFDKTIEEFLRRYYNRLFHNKHVDLEGARKLCFDYLIEECSCLCLWTKLNCNFEVYPSNRNLAMQETHNRFIIPFNPELLHSICLKFKNRKQLKAQSFETISNYN